MDISHGLPVVNGIVYIADITYHREVIDDRPGDEELSKYSALPKNTAHETFPTNLYKAYEGKHTSYKSSEELLQEYNCKECVVKIKKIPLRKHTSYKSSEELLQEYNCKECVVKIKKIPLHVIKKALSLSTLPDSRTPRKTFNVDYGTSYLKQIAEQVYRQLRTGERVNYRELYRRSLLSTFSTIKFDRFVSEVQHHMYKIAELDAKKAELLVVAKEKEKTHLNAKQKQEFINQRRDENLKRKIAWYSAQAKQQKSIKKKRAKRKKVKLSYKDQSVIVEKRHREIACRILLRKPPRVIVTDVKKINGFTIHKTVSNTDNAVVVVPGSTDDRTLPPMPSNGVLSPYELQSQAVPNGHEFNIDMGSPDSEDFLRTSQISDDPSEHLPDSDEFVLVDEDVSESEIPDGCSNTQSEADGCENVLSETDGCSSTQSEADGWNNTQSEVSTDNYRNGCL